MPLLRIANLSVGFEDRTILKGLSFEVFDRELLMLMGPAGVGKSTLLRALGRYDEAVPSFWRHGSVTLDGTDLLHGVSAEEARRQVALLAQKARLFTATVGDNAIVGARGGMQLTYREKRDLMRRVLEQCQLWQTLADRLDHPVTSLSIAQQRMLCVARLVGGGARCVLADEPFRDIAPEDHTELLTFFERLKTRCAVVVIAHEQDWARRLATRICLLVAGQIVEIAPSAQFFDSPANELSREFVRTGNCWPKDGVVRSHAPETPTSSGHPSWRPTPEESKVRPGGFHWIVEGRLGGTQWPGLMREQEQDLRALEELGIQHLVSLTEQPFPAAELERFGIKSHHFPVADMDVPSLSAAHALCQQLSQWMDAGEPVVLHCKAGLGRTGTALACALAYRGHDPVSLVHELRQINRYYIQSEKQLEFVSAFWAYAQAMGGRVTPDSEGGATSTDGARPFVDEALHS